MTTSKRTPESVLRYGHIATRLRRYMADHDINAAELGKRLETSGATVSTWIRAAGQPSEIYRARLAKLTGISEREFMARDPDADPPPLPAAPRGETEARRGRPPIAHGNRNQVLSFAILADGSASISLNLQTTRERAFAIFRLLMEAGVEAEIQSQNSNDVTE